MHRIAHVVGVRWWSAIASYAIELAHEQTRAGDRVRLHLLRGSPAVTEARSRGFGDIGLFDATLAGEVRLLRALRAEIAHQGLDVLHVHTGAGHLAAELARRGRRDVALVRTRADVRAPSRTPWNRWLYARADEVALSASVLRRGVNGLVVPSRVAVIHAGVALDRYDPAALTERADARRRLGIAEEALVLGLVARFSPVKGHRFVLEALAELRALDPPVRAVFAGEPAQLDEADIRAMARAHGVEDRLLVLGRVPDVRAIFGAIDLGVVASTGSEAVCRVAAEYMACGLPVVSTTAGVLPEMVLDGRTGLLVAPGDARALAAAVGRLHADPAARRAMGMAARERAVSALSLASMRDRYDALYDVALAPLSRVPRPIPDGAP